MRAAFMTAVNEVEVREDAAEPAADPAGAVLRVEACGICGTDARTFFNGDPKAPPPWQLGHEPVGVLEEVGPDADLPPGVAAGDRVFLGSILTCGECRWCVEGLQNLCEHHLLYGYDPFPGAYAEWASVPPIATKNLIPLPAELPSDLATVADPFACALNGVEMLDVRLGDTVVILGTGPIGCWQAVMCRDRGASRIYLTDVKEDRLRVALDVVGHFVDDAEFLAMRDRGEFVESAEVHGYRYGTSKRVIADALARGQDLILEIDWQGARQVRAIYPDCVGIFILPPSVEELERRMRSRAQDSDAVIRRRLANAREELEHSGEFEYRIINKDFDTARRELAQIIREERARAHGAHHR